MKILIAPMSSMSETSGPYSRAAALCHKLIERGHEVALCAAEDVNYKPIENVRNYYAPVPSPFGAPMLIGKGLLKVAKLFKIQEKKNVKSYEEVLHFVGATDSKHFHEDVCCIRRAIKDFKPDVVYAEFRLSAIVASKLEDVKVATGYSYPASKAFASNPELSIGVKKFLHENKLPKVKSVLDIFDWADLKIVPSSRDLEPIDDVNAVFTGPFFVPDIKAPSSPKNKIIAYMGFGTISPDTVKYVLTEAFKDTGFEVYIASEELKPFKEGNINIDKRFDFSKLMPQAAAYINHGGQNSIMTGLMYGVPQIVCPGNNFERRYNASSIVTLGAGVMLSADNFNADNIKKIVSSFNNNLSFAVNSRKAGRNLLNLGGVDKAADAIEYLVSPKYKSIPYNILHSI